MKRLVVAVLALSLIGLAGASAADMPARPVYKAPPPPALYSWAGFYIGVNAGGGWSRFDTATRVPGGAPFFLFDLESSTVEAAGTRRVRNDSFIGGGQVGYNWQSGSIVVGLEADFDYFHPRASVSGAGRCVPLCIIGPTEFTLTQSAHTDWLFTARPRAGLAIDNWLFYATGGVAVTEIHYGTTWADDFIGTVTASLSKTKAGWVAGGGIEWGIAPRWSLRAEYLHVDFGSVTITDIITSAAVLDHRLKLDADIVRAALNYRFDWGAPVVAKY